jgi:hypothetical protein
MQFQSSSWGFIEVGIKVNVLQREFLVAHIHSYLITSPVIQYNFIYIITKTHILI